MNEDRKVRALVAVSNLRQEDDGRLQELILAVDGQGAGALIARCEYHNPFPCNVGLPETPDGMPGLWVFVGEADSLATNEEVLDMHYPLSFQGTYQRPSDANITLLAMGLAEAYVPVDEREPI